MRHGAILGLTIATIITSVAPAWAQKKGRGGEQEAVKNGWLFSFTEAKAQARKSGKPIMAVVRCVP